MMTEEPWVQVTEDDILKAEGRHSPCACGPTTTTAKGYYVHGCIVHDEKAFRRHVLDSLKLLRLLHDRKETT